MRDQTALANLADSTGGILIANANDLRGPIRKLAEDIQTYYEITYAPDIKNYDGSFHKIGVKMPSSNLRVQSRSGYGALPPSLSSPGTVLRPYEVLLLTALNYPELPKAFSFESEAMHFRGLGNQPVCDLVMDVPLANVTFQKSNAADQFRGHLSYVVLLKDGQGEVVKKFQNDIPIIEPVARLEAFKANHFIYTEHFDLPPGHYTLETAVLDGEGNRISARTSSVMMAPSAGLAISSVSIVRSTKEREASTEDGDPMSIGTKVIFPTLNPVISKASTSVLPFYLVIYTDKKGFGASAVGDGIQQEWESSGNGLAATRSPRQGRSHSVRRHDSGQPARTGGLHSSLYRKARVGDSR